jgi:hypothetical protein
MNPPPMTLKLLLFIVFLSTFPFTTFQCNIAIDSTLMIHFNNAQHVSFQLPFLKRLYKPHFRKLYFYSDTNEEDRVFFNQNLGVYQVSTTQGHYMQRAVAHYLQLAKQENPDVKAFIYTNDDAYVVYFVIDV